MNDHLTIKDIFIHKYLTESRDWTSQLPRKKHYLAYQKEGTVIHRMNDGRVFNAAPDTVLFLNVKDGYDAHAVEFGYSLVAQLDIQNAPESFIIDCSSDKTMQNLFTTLYCCRNLNLNSNYYRALANVYEIFGLISRRNESEYMQSSTEGKLYAVKLYIEEHYSDPTLTLEKLSAISGLSAHHMSLLFKKKFGVSCWQYVIDTRIEAAVKLIFSPGYTIKMVAEQCGFCDAYYFSRMFKKYMNISPQAYRENEKR